MTEPPVGSLASIAIHSALCGSTCPDAADEAAVLACVDGVRPRARRAGRLAAADCPCDRSCRDGAARPVRPRLGEGRRLPVAALVLALAFGCRTRAPERAAGGKAGSPGARPDIVESLRAD